MKKRIGFAVAAVMIMFCLTAGAALAAGGSTTFGVSTTMSKIGDAWGHPTYGGGYHAIAVDGSEIFAAFGDRNAQGDIEVVVGSSYDGGNKWERNDIVASGQIDEAGITLAIASDPSNPDLKDLYLVWGEYDSVNSRWSVMFSSRWRNQSGVWSSWSTPEVISGTHNITGWRISIAADPTGGVHVAYNASNGDVYYVGSSDYGSNFSSPYYIGNGNAEPCVAADSSGNVFIAWNQWISSSDNSVYLTKKVSGNWSTVKVNGTYRDSYPSIAVYDASNIYIAWSTSDSGTWPIVVASTSNGGATEADWTQEVAASYGSDPSIAVDGSNAPSIVYDGDTGVEFVRYSANKWGSPVTVIDDGCFANLAVDASGKANVMFADYSEDAVYFSKEQ